MLVLTRKESEKILIGDDIEITVLNIDSGQVQIGIDAPEDIVILRQEIMDEIKEDNYKSAKAGPNSLNKLLKTIKNRENSLD